MSNKQYLSQTIQIYVGLSLIHNKNVFSETNSIGIHVFMFVCCLLLCERIFLLYFRL